MIELLRPSVSMKLLMYKALFSLAIFYCLFPINNDSLASVQNSVASPSDLVEKVAMQMLTRIKNQKHDNSDKIDDLQVIIEEELMPYVDYKFAAFKVLGHNVRKANSEELKDFVEAFRNNLILSYSTGLSGLNDHQIEVEPLTSLPSNGFVNVKSLVISSNGPPANILFKLRLGPKTKVWQVYDIQAEGISLITSKKSEIDPIIRKYGIKGAIELLNNVKVES